MIAIVDYGMGNLQSVLNVFDRLGIQAKITAETDEIESAGKIILPGVGHYAKAMSNIRERNQIEVLNKKVIEEKTPILGICLGMQLFTKLSYEGYAEGLGWIDALTVRFDSDKMKKPMKIPHMGWNTIRKIEKSSILDNTKMDDFFYFVHSYHVICEDVSDILSYTDYGYEFVSAVQKGNIIGTQFHPEKSHKKGFEILKIFAEMDFN